MTSLIRSQLKRIFFGTFVSSLALGVIGTALPACNENKEVQVPAPQPRESSQLASPPHSGRPRAPAPLTAEEERVIVHKGTERPFSGTFVDHHADGTYTCRRCGSPLFPSDAKFDSGSGWPSFDDALPGAVKEVPDADGSRTEIVCARCGAHLGHVFRGEGFSAKNTRHCVNSVSLGFKPAEARGAPAGSSRPSPAPKDGPTAKVMPEPRAAYFAGGCFWGVEYYLEMAPGVIDVVSGYMGGSEPNPTYEEVSAHATGHAETVKVTYDPSKTSYEALAKLFFEIHDPTQVGRQGPDLGEQYRSAVFVTSREERAVVLRLIQKLQAKGLRVATQVEEAKQFWPAEAYHQDYYARTRKTPYCHTRINRFGE